MEKNSKPLILIVDDIAANIFALERLLEDNDRIVLTANSGKEALHITLNNNVDLIILDVQMPDMDGFEVAQILKSNKRTKDIPIIFATAFSKEHRFVIKGYEEGAVDYLYKPLDPEIVKAKVSILLKLQLQKKELIEKNLALEKSALLINNSADIIGIIDEETLQIEEINPAFTSLIGVTPEEAKGKPLPVFLTPESKIFVQNLKDEKKDHLLFETGVYYKDKTTKWLQWKVVVKYGRWFANARDITHLKEASEEIRRMNKNLEKLVAEKTRQVVEQEKQYRFLLENMREGIQVISFDWRYLYVNNAVLQQAKYSAFDMVNHTMMEKYPGIEKTDLFKVLNKCMVERKSEMVENEFIYPDSTKRWFELSIQPVPDGLFILSIDISERKKAEERLDIAINAGRIGIWELDLLNDTSVRNATHDMIFGYREQINEWSSKTFLQHIVTEDRPHVQEAFDIARHTQKLNFETRIAWPDNTVHWIAVTGKVLFDPSGKPSKMLGTVIDITPLKESEFQLKKVNEELKKRALELQASNIELERFAFIASHDLQEPLRMITGFLSLLKAEDDSGISENSKSYIRYAIEGAERMKRLIEALLEYSRIDMKSDNMKTVDCNKVVKDVKQVLQLIITKTNASINLKPLPLVKGVESELQQLFQNLISNALKYHNHGAPEIEVGCCDEVSKWKFYIKDNGIGIDPKYHDKIFIIFQRLHNKEAYSGTGIGLAICKKIVEKHGGDIWVESAEGKGSTFYFTIPKLKL